MDHRTCMPSGILLHTPKGQFKISYYHIYRDAQLLVKLKLTKADGTSAPKQDAKVSVQNNVLHTLFESIGHIFHISHFNSLFCTFVQFHCLISVLAQKFLQHTFVHKNLQLCCKSCNPATNSKLSVRTVG